MTTTEAITLTLRATLEATVVAALAYWGFHADGVLLAVAAPVAGFGFWGAVDFRQAGRLAEPLRLVQELAVSGLAALGLWAAGQPAVGAALAALSLGYHALVYAQGARLLTPTMR